MLKLQAVTKSSSAILVHTQQFGNKCYCKHLSVSEDYGIHALDSLGRPAASPSVFGKAHMEVAVPPLHLKMDFYRAKISCHDSTPVSHITPVFKVTLIHRLDDLSLIHI